jgi:hypothetical protein
MPGAGYPIAAEALDLELYQLACTFAASQELTRLFVGHPSLRYLVSVFQQSEAARRLVSVAAMLRNCLDTDSAMNRRHSNQDVGTLTTGAPAGVGSPLGFREACNKLLHAESIELSACGDDSLALSYQVVIEGSRGEQDWRAVLDVLRFIEVASQV